MPLADGCREHIQPLASDQGGHDGTSNPEGVRRSTRERRHGARDPLPGVYRLGRNLRHLITLLDELQALGVAFVSPAEGIDATTPAGKLQMHILAEFERERIRERVMAGLARARREGKRLGRPEKIVPESVLAPVRGLPIREAARRLGVSPTTAFRWLSRKTMGVC